MIETTHVGSLPRGAKLSALLLARDKGEYYDAAEFERVVVANVGGTPVRISDIGRVVDGVEEPRSLARLNGVPAVVLEVRKQAGTNTLELVEHVSNYVAERNALRSQIK